MNGARELELSKKWMELNKLRQGAKIKLYDGQECEFIRLKQKKFVGILNGKSYDIPVGMFTEVISNVPERNLNKEISRFKPGELFYINKGRDAVLYQFVSIKGNYIHAKNPADGSAVKIPISMYGGGVKDIKWQRKDETV